MNTFFSNPAKNLMISVIEDVNPFAEKTSHLILKVSIHPSFIATNNVTKGFTFQFSSVGVDYAFKVIKNSARVKLPKVTKFLHVF